MKLRKLELKKQFIADLNSAEMEEVRGGTTPTVTSSELCIATITIAVDTITLYGQGDASWWVCNNNGGGDVFTTHTSDRIMNNPDGTQGCLLGTAYVYGIKP